MESMTRFITTKLKLKVNEQKSAVARPWERKFLGFSFTGEREPKRRIAPKAVVRVQGAGSGTDAPDAGREHGADGRRNWPDTYEAGLATSGNAKHRRCCEVLRSGSGAGCGLLIWKQWKRGSVRFAPGEGVNRTV